MNFIAKKIQTMVASKRKSARESEQIPSSPPKRIKKNRHESTPRKSKFSEEAETDSDPIIESETASESGDDGASWPSDSEQEDFGGFDETAETGVGTLDIAAEAASTGEAAQKDGNKSGKARIGDE